MERGRQSVGLGKVLVQLGQACTDRGDRGDTQEHERQKGKNTGKQKGNRQKQHSLKGLMSRNMFILKQHWRRAAYAINVLATNMLLTAC